VGEAHAGSLPPDFGPDPIGAHECATCPHDGTPLAYSAGIMSLPRLASSALYVCFATLEPLAHAAPPKSAPPPRREDHPLKTQAGPPISAPNPPFEEYPLKSRESPPRGYHAEERPRQAPLHWGLFVGGVAYVIGFTNAAVDGFENQKSWLIAPVVGPWMTLALRHAIHCPGDFFLTCNGQTNAFLVLDGVAQLAGTALLIAAVTAPRTWAVPDARSSVTLRPLLTSHGYGLSVGGAL
jgi:hypothetical protein